MEWSWMFHTFYRIACTYQQENKISNVKIYKIKNSSNHQKSLRRNLTKKSTSYVPTKFQDEKTTTNRQKIYRHYPLSII